MRALSLALALALAGVLGRSRVRRASPPRRRHKRPRLRRGPRVREAAVAAAVRDYAVARTRVCRHRCSARHELRHARCRAGRASSGSSAGWGLAPRACIGEAASSSSRCSLRRSLRPVLGAVGRAASDQPPRRPGDQRAEADRERRSQRPGPVALIRQTAASAELRTLAGGYSQRAAAARARPGRLRRATSGKSQRSKRASGCPAPAPRRSAAAPRRHARAGSGHQARRFRRAGSAAVASCYGMGAVGHKTASGTDHPCRLDDRGAQDAPLRHARRVLVPGTPRRRERAGPRALRARSLVRPRTRASLACSASRASRRSAGGS